jgi:hypothetical protein
MNQESLCQIHRNQSRPIFEMLKHKKSELGDVAWKKLVRSTEQSILKSPDQYLSDFSKEDISNLVIHRFFDEFLDEST